MFKKLFAKFKQTPVIQKITDSFQEHVTFCDPIEPQRVYNESETLEEFIKKLDGNTSHFR